MVRSPGVMDELVQPFEAEVGRVLEIVVNALYKERAIFLRELISNASDACDKLRYESLNRPELLGSDPKLEIRIVADPGTNILSVVDNGIGMDKDELAANLGTIARSGTARFLEQLTGDRAKDLKLIGQFGVGFYSVFMVADKVIVRSTRAGQDKGWIWASDGKTGFTVREDEEPLPRGTAVILHLKDDAKEFLDAARIREIVRTYSDHIAFPIILEAKPRPGDTRTKAHEPQQINKASALWARPRSEITEEQYREFYHHVAHTFDDPFARIHFTAEGTLSYTALLFLPAHRPFDLYDPRRRHGVRLYVRRVFITDQLEELLPRYLRFVSGVVDSEDLQLNVSRETLQHGIVVQKMRRQLTKRVLDELARKASETAETSASATAGETGEPDGEVKKGPSYLDWWAEFGAVLKEGLFEDPDNRERLLELARFKSTRGPGWVSLAEYVARMRPNQDQIFYITGESAEALRTSPQLEAALAKGCEVLLLDDAVDEFWLGEVKEYQGKKFVSLTKGEVDLSRIPDEGKIETPDELYDEDLKRLLAKLKALLGEEVKDVRASKRLRESAVCLVADEHGLDFRLERILRQHHQIERLARPVLEVNGRHELIRRMAAMAKDASREQDLAELAKLLLDQARIVQGEPVPDPGAFSRRMSAFLARGLPAAA
ncbi:MAG: molecular chaperone HtpG [Geminicoccaceae bacterium]|nr:molecular chaperone HtpG [Geminicoccaceae bacterium]